MLIFADDHGLSWNLVLVRSWKVMKMIFPKSVDNMYSSDSTLRHAAVVRSAHDEACDKTGECELLDSATELLLINGERCRQPVHVLRRRHHSYKMIIFEGNSESRMKESRGTTNQCDQT
jgi:hypothetical protein